VYHRAIRIAPLKACMERPLSRARPHDGPTRSRRCDRRQGIRATRLVALLGAVFALNLIGCQSAMSTPVPLPPENPSVAGASALRFDAHNFEAHCYDTTGCKVLYNDHYHVRDADDATRPAAGPDHRRRWSGASYIGVKNFPAPAVVTWRSKDGQAHRAEIDIGEIFADQVIRHQTAAGDIPDNAYVADPDIFLEVDDRTINVFMKAHIPLKAPRVPGNRFTNFAEDFVLAFTRTY
jgi:hypothetical protein